ncbi:hypothetical protein EBT31_07325 [bacterium]|nr:hypothetical protein [bacterium]NBX49717.1 hypothetical protein [bacterium]
MTYTTRATTRTAIPSKATLIAQGMSDLEAQQLIDADRAREYGGGMSQAELQDFETLISRLEGSKMRQAAQANRARQRDVMAGGLASMMTNF